MPQPAKDPAICNIADHLASIERLAPLIAGHRADFDRERRLPDAVIRALAEARLLHRIACANAAESAGRFKLGLPLGTTRF